MNNHKFLGNHILAELYDVDERGSTNKRKLIKALLVGIKKAGATPIKTVTYKFKPEGMTIFILLKESHVSLHIYPEFKAIFFDAFTCGTANPEVILKELTKMLSPQEIKIKNISRGIIESSS